MIVTNRGGETRGRYCAPPSFLQRVVLLEEVFQGHRIGELAALHQLRDRSIDTAIDPLGEMLGARGTRKPGETRALLTQNRCQQSLLGLDIGRRLAVKRLALAQRQETFDAVFSMTAMLPNSIGNAIAHSTRMTGITGINRERGQSPLPASAAKGVSRRSKTS